MAGAEMTSRESSVVDRLPERRLQLPDLQCCPSACFYCVYFPVPFEHESCSFLFFLSYT